MKKWIAAFCLFLFASLSFATPIKKFVFFGDSLTDSGNLYNVIFHLLPKTPPYYQGRFTNGPTWAEVLGKSYNDKFAITSKNYAYGGATAVLHMPNLKFIAPTTLPIEVDFYLLGSLLADQSDTLFSIWIGGNDYLFADIKTNPEKMTDEVVASVIAQMNKLIGYGAKQFVILNLPDLSKVPFGTKSDMGPRFQLLTFLHNLKLSQQIEVLKKSHPDVKVVFIDMFYRFNDLINNPQKYNDRYKVRITHIQEGCWNGGFFIKNMLSKSTLTKELQMSLLSEATDRKKLAMVPDVADMIMKNPLLADVYQGGKLYEQGARPCDNPEGYIFWDGIHPSALVHRILAILVAREINRTFSQFDQK